MWITLFRGFPLLRRNFILAAGFYLFKVFFSLLVILPAGVSLVSFLSQMPNASNFLEKIDWNLLLEFFNSRAGTFGTLGASFLLALPLVIVGYIFFLGGVISSLNHSRGGGQYNVSGWTFFADSARFFKPLLLLQLMLYLLYGLAVILGVLLNAALMMALPDSLGISSRTFWSVAVFLASALPFFFVNMAGDYAKLITVTEDRKAAEALRASLRYIRHNFKIMAGGYFILLGFQLFLSAVLLVAEKGLSLPSIFLGLLGQQMASLLKAAYRVFAFGAELEILKTLPPLPIKTVSATTGSKAEAIKTGDEK